MTRRQPLCTSPMNVARRPIWLLLVVAICAAASVMGMATSAHLAASLPGAAGTPVGSATPTSMGATPAATPTSSANRSIFPSSTEINDIDRAGSDIVKSALPASIPLANKRIYDTGLLINTVNEKTLEGDARVLASYGVPILVYVRRSPDSIAESQAFADNLRLQRRIESAPGADDGLVMLLTTNVQSSYGGNVVFSTGAHTLPVHGLDQAVIDRIQAEDIVPRLRQGKFYDALNISLRHMSYSAQFVPGPVPPTSLHQDMVASLLLVVAPLGTVLLALASGILWMIPAPQFLRLG
ncbi:MAG: TPM domain-containing protein, partial [Thermomicrobiales bacterium]